MKFLLALTILSWGNLAHAQTPEHIKLRHPSRHLPPFDIVVLFLGLTTMALLWVFGLCYVGVIFFCAYERSQGAETSSKLCAASDEWEAKIQSEWRADHDEP